MKIEKLYTTSQFVDEITNGELSTIVTKTDNISQTKLYLIYKYNLFLKQPLTKEMFINEIKKPFDDDEKYTTIWLPDINGYDFDELAYIKDLKVWEKAENKVILGGFTKRISDHGIMYDNGELDIFIEEKEFKTLYEIAECFKGEIELKNVEI